VHPEPPPPAPRPQSVTVRNAKGRALLDLIQDSLETQPAVQGGDRTALVVQTLRSDDDAKFGKGPAEPMPRWLGNILASVVEFVGPKGLEFAKYSIEYHYLRNYLYVNRVWGEERAGEHVPGYVRRVVDRYDKDGTVAKLLEKGRPVF